MRVFRPIVLPLAQDVVGAEAELASGKPIGFEPVGDELSRRRALILELLTHQPRGRGPIASALDQHVQHLAFAVDGATGIMKDEVAVTAALNLPCSNGQTEGQITRLKLVKRQIYGRGKIDMLQARMIGVT